jgi:tetratricopeptide (TPR) repeat protein
MKNLTLAEIGAAAAAGRTPEPETLERAKRLALAAPLSPDPFLIDAANAMQMGRVADAEQLLKQAVQRDPRSSAARFLLADIYLRSGQVQPGLRELVALSRIRPAFAGQLSAVLASFARTPGAVPTLKAALAEDPTLEPAVLNELSADAANARLVLSLASPTNSQSPKEPDWVGRLTAAMLGQGRVGEAYNVWSKYSPSARQNKHGFSFTSSASPFFWKFHESPQGVAEEIGGELRVSYPGTEDVTLASRVFALAPGRYRLQVAASGNLAAASNLEWSVSCLPGSGPAIAAARLSSSASGSGVVAINFLVPETCAGQRLELKGIADTIPVTSEVILSSFRIVGTAS